ncbi:MAG TPA: helix-turn-helix domain-containing protein [Pseudonocardiaceae bacterium]
MPAPLRTPVVVGRPCSVAAALELVGDRWSLLIVREVLFGNHRFSQIARNTGAPRDRLSARLKALVAASILERRRYQDSPPRDEYHLSPAGRDLVPVLESLRRWGDKWGVDSPPLTVLHRDHPFRARTVCAGCGEHPRAEDLHSHINAAGWAPSGPISREG